MKKSKIKVTEKMNSMIESIFTSRKFLNALFIFSFSLLLTFIFFPFILHISFMRTFVMWLKEPMGNYGGDYLQVLGIVATITFSTVFAVYNMKEANKREKEKINYEYENVCLYLTLFARSIRDSIEQFKNNNYVAAKDIYDEYAKIHLKIDNNKFIRIEVKTKFSLLENLAKSVSQRISSIDKKVIVKKLEDLEKLQVKITEVINAVNREITI